MFSFNRSPDKKTVSVQPRVLVLFWQSPLGNSNDSCHAEVPKPDEPQRGRSRCPGQTRRQEREAAQPQAAQYRVGNTLHCEIGGYCGAELGTDVGGSL